jgi:hypothetical protein
MYTVNVDRYLNEFRLEKYWQEDVIFCGGEGRNTI